MKKSLLSAERYVYGGYNVVKVYGEEGLTEVTVLFDSKVVTIMDYRENKLYVANVKSTVDLWSKKGEGGEER